MAIEAGAKVICDVIEKALNNDHGALIGRNGTIELEQMINITSNKLHILEKNAGIYPIAIHRIFYRWQEDSIKATQSADVLATGWYEPLKEAEELALERWNVKAKQVPLRSLEPYYVNKDQWTHLLSGHKVAVVTSFAKSASQQVSKLDNIWGSKNLFPSDVEWAWIQTGHPGSVARGRNEWPSHVHSWAAAADYVVAEVMKSGARFALIGCGGLGMPIAKMLKDRGIITIVLGGAIQVLFGIKGNRWRTHEVISKFWNDAWVWPSESETPAGADMIEGGCYWLSEATKQG
jgi:hypothetical protein